MRVLQDGYTLILHYCPAQKVRRVLTVLCFSDMYDKRDIQEYSEKIRKCQESLQWRSTRSMKAGTDTIEYKEKYDVMHTSLFYFLTFTVLLLFLIFLSVI